MKDSNAGIVLAGVTFAVLLLVVAAIVIVLEVL